MDEREQDAPDEEQEPKGPSSEDSGILDHKDHSDAPGPFGTGEEQDEQEAAGNPQPEESEEE